MRLPGLIHTPSTLRGAEHIARRAQPRRRARTGVGLLALALAPLTAFAATGSADATMDQHLAPSITSCSPQTLVSQAADAAGVTSKRARDPRAADLAPSDVLAAASEPVAATVLAAARRHDLDSADLSDPSLRLHGCERFRYVEEEVPARALVDARRAGAEHGPGTSTPLTSLDDTFSLHSNPTSQRTIYLNFLGAEVTDTFWNDDYKRQSINARPYSSDANVSTNFSAAELAEIQRTWQAVAEDYAVFDVDVTTQRPGTAALLRASESDEVYGSEVVFTAENIIDNNCSCGGTAYLDVFDFYGSDYRRAQPAWVFADSTAGYVKLMADAASHEIGHNFGLAHDGVRRDGERQEYHLGDAPWAPIMGASYYQPLTQWSRGDYAQATNTEDDLALIARHATRIEDDITSRALGGTSVPPTLLDFEATSGSGRGLVNDGSDRDFFSITVSERTERVDVIATPADPTSALDTRISLIDTDGVTVLATNAPTTTARDDFTVAGTGAGLANLTFDSPGIYYVVIEGAGQGNPGASGYGPGSYSSYGSLGSYTVEARAKIYRPVKMTGRLPSARVGRAFRASLEATAGTAPMTWRRTSGSLPPGISASAAGKQRRIFVLSGKPRKPGRYAFTISLTDARGTVATRSFKVRVSR